MKVKIAAVATASIVLIVCASLSHYWGQASSTVYASSAALSGGGGFMQFDPADSPINMGGGSIFINAKNGWTRTPGQRYQYTAQSNNIGTIATTGINGVATSLTLQGFVVTVANRSRNNGRKVAAITVSSDPSPACFSAAGCRNPSIGDNQTVYISIRAGSRWIENGPAARPNQVRFHDTECDSPSNNGENPQCDHLLDVTFQSQNRTISGACNGGTCKVGFGR